MQSFCSSFILGGEGAGNSFFPQSEQFFALSFRAFKSALHDCAALLSLLFGEIQFAHQVAHAAAAPALTLMAPHFPSAAHFLTMSFHPLDSLFAEGVFLRRRCLRLGFLSESS